MGRNLGPLNIKDSYEGLVQISGSQLTDGSGSLIPSLDVTASFATTATSASHALNADNAISSSYAVTASFALNVTPTPTGSFMVTGSATDATLTFTKGDASIFDLVVNNVANATSASFATTATNAVSASIADSATTAVLATTASHAIFADTASFLPADTNLNINSITASNASFTSASIGYLQTITGSAKIIGDAFIILNNNTPTERYAGLVVQDSGSTNNTASLEFDGQTNDWFYEYTDDGGATVDHGVAMFGPEYNTKGVPTYLTNNTIPKGDGGHHLNDSNITDDGSITKVSAKLHTENVNATGINSVALGGQGGTASGNQASIIGGFNNNASGTQAFVAGGGLSTVSDQRGAVIAGYQHNVLAEDSVIIGGFNSDVLATHVRSVVLGGNALTTTKADEVVVPHLTISGSTIATDISASGYVSASSFIGDGSQLSGISSDPFPYTGSAEILGTLEVGNSSNTTTGTYAVNFGGDGTANSVTGTNSSVLGGFGNTVSQNHSIGSGRQNTISGGQIQTIMGGLLNTISATEATNGIFSGKTSTISGTSENSAIIGGVTSTIASHDRSVIIGGTGLSTTKDDEVVVPSLSIYGDTFISASVLGTGSLIDNLGQEAIVTGSQVQHIVNLSQAEYDALTPDANTLYVIDGAETLGDTNVDGKLTGTVNTISDSGGTTALDCSVGNYFTLAMPAGGTTNLVPSNVTAGQTINIEITQNATAATLTYDNTIEFPGGTAFTISTGAGEVDVLTLVSFDGVNLKATGLANFS